MLSSCMEGSVFLDFGRTINEKIHYNYKIV